LGHHRLAESGRLTRPGNGISACQKRLLATQGAAQNVQKSRNVHGCTSVAEDMDVRERPDIQFERAFDSYAVLFEAQINEGIKE
jgi:hypothetical protein